jgi:hypothetical protein
MNDHSIDVNIGEVQMIDRASRNECLVEICIVGVREDACGSEVWKFLWLSTLPASDEEYNYICNIECVIHESCLIQELSLQRDSTRTTDWAIFLNSYTGNLNITYFY